MLLRAPHRPGRRGTLIAVLTATVLGLTACTGSGSPGDPTGATGPAGGSAAPAPPVGTTPPTPDEWRHDVPMQPLTVPTEMVAAADRLDGGDLIAGTPDRPAVSAVIRTSPDGRRHLRILSWDGTTWQATDVGPDVPGEPQSAALAGGESVAAVGGWTWEAGTIWPYLLTSTDRRTWTPVQLPQSLDGSWVSGVAVDGGRVAAIARNAGGDAATIVIDPTRTGQPEVTALPAVPDGQRRAVDAIAVKGDALVVTAEQGPPTGETTLLALHSPDAGRTWSESNPIGSGERRGLTGVTALPSGFLITGHDPIPDDPDRSVRAAAWFSPDGISWQAETVPEPDGFRWKDHNSGLGRPEAAGEYALAVALSTSSRTSRLYQRQPTGEWIALAETNQVADDAGRGGWVAPAVQPTGSGAPGAVFMAIDGAHGTVIGTSASGVWATSVAPTMYRDPPHFSELITGGPEWRMLTRQRQFLPFGNGGFRTVNEPALVGLSGDALAVLPWDPAQAGDFEDVEPASAGTAEVVLVGRLTENESARTISGWYRAGTGQPWQPVSGFGEQPDESMLEVIHIGDRWILWGNTSDKVTGDVAQAMMWTSADGVSWSRAQGDFADGDRSSSIGRVCTDPAGRPAAVGWLLLTDELLTATMWSEQNGRWQRSTLPADPSVGSRFSWCGTVGGRLVIEGYQDGRRQRWTVDATGAFHPEPDPVVDVVIPDRHGFGDPIDLQEVRSVPGGYLATGAIRTSTYSGPVLWLSADGTTWTWIPVPAAQPDPSVHVGVDGADLIVASGATNVSQAWRIPGIGSVIASIPAG